MDTHLITLIKSKNNAKSDKDSVKNKFRRDPTSEKSNLYEYKTAFFDNGYPEVFLLFVRKFHITLEALGVLTVRAKIQYLCNLLCGIALSQLDTLYVEVGSTTMTQLNHIILD